MGPVAPPPKSRYQEAKQQKKAEEESDADEEENEEEDDEVLSSASEELDSEDEVEDAMEVDEDSGDSEAESSEAEEEEEESDLEEAASAPAPVIPEPEQSNKKRKRGNKEDEVEDAYMRKLAREELKEEEARKKKQKTSTAAADTSADTAADSDSDADDITIPKHESQMETPSTDATELEKATRTVFLGNVSSDAITSKTSKKTLLRHLASFIPDLPDNKPPHKVESLRFRSVAFTGALPKKAAFAKKEILDATTKSTNAYAVYSTPLAAREAAKRLNGTVVLGRHLRVDNLAHPAKTDHRRCVFVGGLSFVDDESTATTEDGEKKKSKKPPADIEEGLWQQFSKAGKVENVRVVRDAKTRVGKGIAYVQFEDENGVEAALQFNDQKFPPLLPRKLRVTRARAQKAKPKKVVEEKGSKGKGVYNAKITPEQKTQQGRAAAMLGKAGASKAKETFVFEGHRASAKQGNSGLKLGGKSKRKGKPSNRSAKRAAAWQKAGGKAQFGK